MNHYTGRTKTANCDPNAWEYIKSDYLRLERPSFAACYRRLLQVAEIKGWKIPGIQTLRKRMNREVPLQLQRRLRYTGRYVPARK